MPGLLQVLTQGTTSVDTALTHSHLAALRLLVLLALAGSAAARARQCVAK